MAGTADGPRDSRVGAALACTPAALVLAVTYVAAASFGGGLASAPGTATPVFPAAGVALAGLLLGGTRLWPGVWLGSLAVTLLVPPGGTSLLTTLLAAAVTATGALAEAVLGAALLGRVGGADAILGERGVLVLSLVVAPVGAALSAATGVGALALAGVVADDDVGLQALTWWLGDLTGVLLFTPFLVSWAGPVPVAGSEPGRRTVEVVLLGLLAAAVTWVAFGGVDGHRLPLGFLPIPTLVFVALRGGLRATTTTLLAHALIALWATLRSHGPFQAHDLGRAPALLLLQAYTATAAFAILVLAANLHRRRVAVVGLARARDELELRVRERTLEVESACRRIEAQQQRLALHVQQTPLAVIEWDVGFRVTDWNPSAERIFGWSREEALGRHACELIVPASVREQVDAVWRELLQRRGGERSTNRNVRRDGSSIECEWTNTPLVAASGGVVGVASLVLDVTDRVTMQVERDRLLVAYREALAGRDEFLSVASHELRTPITSLKLASQALLRDGIEVGDRVATVLRMVDRQATRLAQLVDQLLDVSRIREGRLRLDLAQADVGAIVRDAVAGLQAELEASGSTLELDVPDLGPCFVDASRFAQIVTNLTTNAIKYGGGKPIRVALACDDDEVVLTIADQGIGIAAADHGRVFERYTRAVSSRHYGGLGLGLHIVRVLAEAHGGSVEVRSAPGEGATFTVRLPRRPLRVEAPEPVPVTR
jgi:PAS domain S-box-containing protein